MSFLYSGNTLLFLGSFSGVFLTGILFKNNGPSLVKWLWLLFVGTLSLDLIATLILWRGVFSLDTLWEFYLYCAVQFFLMLQAPALFLLVKRESSPAYVLDRDLIFYLALPGSVALGFAVCFFSTVTVAVDDSPMILMSKAFSNMYFGDFHLLIVFVSLGFLFATARRVFFESQSEYYGDRKNQFLLLKIACVFTLIIWGMWASKLFVWWLATQMIPSVLLSMHQDIQFLIGHLRNAAVCFSLMAILFLVLRNDVYRRAVPLSRPETPVVDALAGGEVCATSRVYDLAPDITVADVQKVVHAFEVQQVYLRPNLTVGELCEYSGVSSEALSSVFKRHFKSRFFDQLNRYRIDEAKRLLLEDRGLKVEDVMRRSGFSSRTAFNRAFKFHAGMSPREFRATPLHTAMATAEAS